jgi:hypothetical protein
MTSPPRSLGYALTRRINIMGYLQNLIKKIETVEKQMHTEMYLHSPVAIEVLKNRCIEAISKIKDANNRLIPYGAKRIALNKCWNIYSKLQKYKGAEKATYSNKEAPLLYSSNYRSIDWGMMGTNKGVRKNPYWRPPKSKSPITIIVAPNIVIKIKSAMEEWREEMARQKKEILSKRWPE